MSVYGTDFAINEPTPFDRKWYSHKLKRAAVRYEIAVSISGNIVWFNGPFEAGLYPDVKIFKEGLLHHLYQGENVVTDRGYNHARCIAPYNLFGDDRATASKLRARHETLNGRIKNFKVMEVRFRHKISKHFICFSAVAKIVQLALNESPTFTVRV